MFGRISLVLGIVFVLLGMGVGLVWYLAYGANHAPPASAMIPSLSNQTRILWGIEGKATIEAVDEVDAYAALGFAHGWDRLWPLLLWRQAATGTLSSWDGESALPIDQLILSFRFPHFAKQSFEALPDEEKRLLEAYSRGLNEAMKSRSKQLPPPLLDAPPALDRWEPWHSLAIERLLVWLTVPFPSPPFSENQAWDRIITATFQLRERLQFFGLSHSHAWAIQDSTGAHLFQRHILGAAATPTLFEVTFSTAQPPLNALTFPGYPGALSAQTPSTAWVHLLHSSVQFAHIPLVAPEYAISYSRIETTSGQEHLVSSAFVPSGLVLDFDSTTHTNTDSETPHPDSIWVMQWAGFSNASDFPTVRALNRTATAAFSLFAGHGLWVNTGGTVSLMGQPQHVRTFQQGLFVGNDSWSEYVAARLISFASDSTHIHPDTWSLDTYSPWAAHLAPRLSRHLGGSVAPSPVFEEGVTYLLNWDFHFDGSSIAATIFDRWIGQLRASQADISIFLDELDTDSLTATDAVTLDRSFEATLASLQEEFGPDLSLWRWEDINPQQWHFVSRWPKEQQTRGDLPHRFDSIYLPGAGHPSTLRWGSSALATPLPAPFSWESWWHTSQPDHWVVRRQHFNVIRPLGRFLIDHGPPPPLELHQSATAHTTVLLPPKP